MAKFVEKIGKYSEYILKGFSFLRKKSPIENKATLKEFLLTRAAFISQKTLYGYIKTRAGTKYVTIFNDDRFNNSVNIAKWNIYILCLSDLTLYSINYINSQMKLQDTHNIFQWYNEIFTEELGNIPIVLMSPQGRPLDNKIASGYSSNPHIVLICGRYEGFDERIRTHLATDEVSIGDYVISGGELASMVLMDAVSRFVPGVLGDEESAKNDSFSNGLLEHPHYTRPADYRGKKVPEVLISGNHKEINRWRENESVKRTVSRRPDLLGYS